MVATAALSGLLFLVVLIVAASLLVSGYRLEFASAWPQLRIVQPDPHVVAAARVIAKLGPVGDYIGGLLNPLVALCALIGLLVSLGVQRATLLATRQGLREQLDQENFFTLLGNREKAIESVELRRGATLFRGRAAIQEILRYLDHRTSQVDGADLEESLETWEVPTSLDDGLKRRVGLFAVLYSATGMSEAAAWEQYAFEDEYGVESLEELLGHIFRSTYQVLKFVYRCPSFNLAKKKDLANYLRAQMSEAEFAAFALTALTSIGEKSRAVATAFNLYEKRLQSTVWARGLPPLFDPMNPDAAALAEALGYKVLDFGVSEHNASQLAMS